jgi:nucleotide-binding universal stress UspA family protein
MIAPAKTSVVVPVDFSDESFAAVDIALEHVDDPSHLHVIHVLPDVSAAELEHIWNEIDESHWQSTAKKKLTERLSDAKYDGVELDVRFGSPGDAIVHYAGQVGAELIVMPSHGRRGLKRLLLGSVTERVIRLAECPILVLKPDMP